MLKKTKKTQVVPKKTDLSKQVDKVLAEIKKFSKSANQRYQALDDDSKKKLVAGVGLLAAFAAGALMLKKRKKK